MTVDKQEALRRGADVLGDLVVELRSELARVTAERDARADCNSCVHKHTVGCHCARASWRGPQEAGEEGSVETTEPQP